MNALADPWGYPTDWESNLSMKIRVSVQFGYPDAGWMLMSLLGSSTSDCVVIALSDVFDPFEDLVNWLKAIADGRLPAWLKIDEEGQCKQLVVIPLQGRLTGDAEVELRVVGDHWNASLNQDEQKCFFLARVARKQLLEQFHRRLTDWLANDYTPGMGWHTPYCDDDEPPGQPVNLRHLDLDGLREKINRL